MKTTKITTTAFFLFFLIVASCRKEQTPSEAGEILPEDVVEMSLDQAKLAGVETGSLQFMSIPEKINTNGLVTVSPENMATICAPLGGFIYQCNLLPGDPVKKGQLLARIENQEFIDIQQQYLEVKNRLDFAEAEYKRHSELYKEDVYSKQNLQQVTADYKSLKAQVNAAGQKLILLGINPEKLTEENISRTIPLIAPISGYLKTVTVNMGKYVNPSDVLFEIVNTSRLLLELNLYEKDMGKVSIGQDVDFYINNEKNSHLAKVNQTGKAIAEDKTCKVFATVMDNCRNVLPGMYVNAEIMVEGIASAALPNDAIVTFNDVDYIFIVLKKKEENGKPYTEYKMVEILKGKEGKDFTEVILPDKFDIKSSNIVLKGAYRLLSAKKNAGEMSC